LTKNNKFISLGIGVLKMSGTIIVSNSSDVRISMGFMHAAMTIVFAHDMDSEEVNQTALRISKYMYQILGSLSDKGEAVASSIQRRIETAPDGDPIFDPEFNYDLFQQCFSATQQALKDICVKPSPN